MMLVLGRCGQNLGSGAQRRGRGCVRGGGGGFTGVVASQRPVPAHLSYREFIS